jgi:predicted amidohydrolase
LPTVLLRHVGSAAELHGVMDQGFLNLSWDAPDAKLEEASKLAGPWQTVLATASPYRVRPSASITNGGRFYRLKMPSPGKKWLKVAAVTMQSKTNTEVNLQTLFSYMNRAASNGVDLIVFPEVALQGCPGWREDSAKPSVQEMAYIQQTAETIPGQSTSIVVAKAKALNLFVVFGMTEEDPAGQLYNANVFLGPEGVIGKHRKTFHVGNDSQIWSRGSGYEVLDSPLGRVGLMICAELWSNGNYPGPVLASQGADLLVTSSAWWTSVASSWDALTKENAVRAQRWHVASQQVGAIGHAQCYGHSQVVDPSGRIVCDTGAAEGLVMWATDILIDIGLR